MFSVLHRREEKSLFMVAVTAEPLCERGLGICLYGFGVMRGRDGQIQEDVFKHGFVYNHSWKQRHQVARLL